MAGDEGDPAVWLPKLRHKYAEALRDDDGSVDRWAKLAAAYQAAFGSMKSQVARSKPEYGMILLDWARVYW
jgi:hypothetical protein